MLNVLLTNDDGIEAEGLQAMRAALAALPDVRLAVIAPDGNRSAMARSITTRRPLWVEEVAFPDGTVGYATDGTPVDCVRLSSLGAVEGFKADLVVPGINHGANLGDDITYSGTVAAALEGVVLGLPAIAVSQQSGARALDFRFHGGFNFDVAAGFVARLVERLERCPAAAARHAAQRQRPRRRAQGVEVASSASASTATSSSWSARRTAHPRAGATGSTATTPASTTSPAPTLLPWRRAAWRSRRCTSTSPTCPASRRWAASTWRACWTPPGSRPADGHRARWWVRTRLGRLVGVTAQTVEVMASGSWRGTTPRPQPGGTHR